MRLNLGCGRHVLDGWVNIDVQVSPRAKRKPEILCDLKEIPLPDEYADDAMAIHVFEHFYRWDAERALSEWRRLLKPGGRLILELPDVIKCCRNLIEGIAEETPGQMSYWGLYGDPREQDPYMCHRWGWTPATLSALLSAQGFYEVREDVPQWHSSGKLKRDMRIVSKRR